MANAATTGALIGLGVGVFHYVVTLAVMGAVASRRSPDEAAGDLPGLSVFARRLRPIKFAMLGICFLALPLVGYAAGAMLSHGEAR